MVSSTSDGAMQRFNNPVSLNDSTIQQNNLKIDLHPPHFPSHKYKMVSFVVASTAFFRIQ